MCPRCEGLVLFMLSAPWDLWYVIKVAFYCICFSICPYLYFILPIRLQGCLESFPWTCWLSCCIDHIFFEKNEGLKSVAESWFFLSVINSWQGTRMQTLVDRMEKKGQGSLVQKSSRSIDIVCLWVCVQGPVSRLDTGNQRGTWRPHELINQSVVWMEIKSKSFQIFLNFSLQVCILLQHCQRWLGRSSHSPLKVVCRICCNVRETLEGLQLSVRWRTINQMYSEPSCTGKSFHVKSFPVIWWVFHASLGFPLKHCLPSPPAFHTPTRSGPHWCCLYDLFLWSLSLSFSLTSWYATGCGCDSFWRQYQSCGWRTLA